MGGNPLMMENRVTFVIKLVSEACKIRFPACKTASPGRVSLTIDRGRPQFPASCCYSARVKFLTAVPWLDFEFGNPKDCCVCSFDRRPQAPADRACCARLGYRLRDAGISMTPTYSK